MSIHQIAAQYGFRIVAAQEPPTDLAGQGRFAQKDGEVSWNFHRSDRGTSRESIRWEGSVKIGDGEEHSALLRVIDDPKTDRKFLSVSFRHPRTKRYELVADTKKFDKNGLKALLTKAAGKIEDMLKDEED